LAPELFRERVTLLIERRLRGLERVAAVEERKELALLRVLVVEDENAAHALRRCHLARRHALAHDLVELLGVTALERGDPYPPRVTPLVDASPGRTYHRPTWPVTQTTTIRMNRNQSISANGFAAR